MSPDEIKKMLGREAAKLVEDGMTVGIGSGSTAYWFIVSLAERIRQGLICTGVPTSRRTSELAREHEVPLITLNEATEIHLAVDGADEANKQLNVIKGGGGALLQEKMVADASKRFVIITDETKVTEKFGKFPLPVEVIPYGWQHMKRKIESMGCRKVILRQRQDKVFVTDHGHYILDCHFEEIEFPATLHSRLNNLPGVVENGMFLNMAEVMLVGHADGTITEFTRH